MSPSAAQAPRVLWRPAATDPAEAADRVETVVTPGSATGPRAAAHVVEPALASRLRLAVVRLNRRLRAQRSDSSVSLTQMAALSTLHKCGPLTPGELAAKERVQPPSMTRVIAALEERGMVRREPHPSDGRQAIVSVTDTGLAYIEAEVALRERWLDHRLAELTADERALLQRAVDLIDRMAEN